jgi:hypothetical protein
VKGFHYEQQTQLSAVVLSHLGIALHAQHRLIIGEKNEKPGYLIK